MQNEKSRLESVYEILTPELRDSISAVPMPERNKICEVRLRTGRMLTATIYSKEYFVTRDGRLMNNPDEGVKICKEDIENAYIKAFRNSLHSFQREITRGYITISGGNRVGFCGTAVLNPSKNYSVENVKNISSVNIRIAREIKGCANELFNRIYSGGNLKSLLVAGPPSSGKTTILRDLTRLIGNIFSTSLIDERNEIAAGFNGIAQNDVGVLTDVFNSYNKYEGIMTAVKVMSPYVLVCDEIGGKEDFQALEYCLNSGVKLVATCHASSIEEAKRRSTISKLFKEKAFDCCAVLGTGKMCGKITAFSELGVKND